MSDDDDDELNPFRSALFAALRPKDPDPDIKAFVETLAQKQVERADLDLKRATMVNTVISVATLLMIAAAIPALILLWRTALP